MLLLLTLAACPRTPADDDAPGETGGDDSAAPASPCPDGMVPVPTDDPAYCIDAWEVTVDDASWTASAVAGVVPSTLYTFDQAVEICANTPVVNAAGETVGYKRIVTSTLWQDAADGQVGEGGLAWPYGDTFDPTACATPTEDGTIQYDALQPTGSLPRCASPFGVYDASGNAFEWADSGYRLDNAAWVAARAAEGSNFELDPAGVRLASGTSNGVSIWMYGVGAGQATLAEDGRVYLDHDKVVQTENSTPGYMVPLGGAHASADFLAVEAVESVEDQRWYFVAYDDDGAPIPDKRGGAYYTGSDDSCRTDMPVLAHYHTFSGTIGFRCVSDPL